MSSWRSDVILCLLFLGFILTSKGQDLDYTISKIEKVRKYFVVYASRNDSLFKIVSKKKGLFQLGKIRKGRAYRFKLRALQFLSGPEIDCMGFGKKTIVCREEEYDELHIATNLIGLKLKK
jgi:hypothetical protein